MTAWREVLAKYAEVRKTASELDGGQRAGSDAHTQLVQLKVLVMDLVHVVGLLVEQEAKDEAEDPSKCPECGKLAYFRRQQHQSWRCRRCGYLGFNPTEEKERPDGL